MVFDNNNETDTYNVISKIAYQIGLSYSFTFASAIPKLTEKFLKSNNCLLILEKLSEALAGYWRIWNGTLLFVPFEETFMTSVTASEHDKIETGIRKEINRVIMTGGGETFDNGTGDFSETFCIDTEFATAELANSVFGRLAGYGYDTLLKTMCKGLVFPAATAEVTFENSPYVNGKVFKVNSVRAYPRRSGLYLELSNNEVREDEWDYSGKTEREIKRLNQLFFELEEGGEEPEPIVDNEPWKRDPDWALFEAMPHQRGENNSNYKQMNVMVKVISESRTVGVWGAYAGGDLTGTFFVDWGDGTPEEDLTATQLTSTSLGSLIPSYKRKVFATHTYTENGIYYVRITTKGNQGSAILLPPYSLGENPPLTIGWKLNWGAFNLLFNSSLKNEDFELRFGDVEFFFKSKFIEVFGSSYDMDSSKFYTMLYNPFWFDFIKKNYIGINSESDLEI
jgi:hypothetical protein